MCSYTLCLTGNTDQLVKQPSVDCSLTGVGSVCASAWPCYTPHVKVNLAAKAEFCDSSLNKITVGSVFVILALRVFVLYWYPMGYGAMSQYCDYKFQFGVFPTSLEIAGSQESLVCDYLELVL